MRLWFDTNELNAAVCNVPTFCVALTCLLCTCLLMKAMVHDTLERVIELCIAMVAACAKVQPAA